MKMRSILFALVSTTGIAATSQANQVPIAVAGYTQNMILGVGETFPGMLTATMDGGTGLGGNTWYALGQNTGAPTTGLPSGTVTSQSDATTTLNLQPAGTSNALLIDGANTSGNFVVLTPGYYSTLSVFGSTGNGANVVDYTLHFLNAPAISGTLTFGDWFGGANVAVDANGRINSGGYDSVGSGNPNIYQVNIPFTYTGQELSSISFAQDPNNGSGSNGGGGHTAIFALSGTTPEPASLGLLVLGGIGVLARRRRA